MIHSAIHKSTVNIILDEADIKPHKITYYCENRDHDFDESGKLITFEDTPIHMCCLMIKSQEYRLLQQHQMI